MHDLFDEAARILARPVPRRQALRQLGGVLAGAIVGALGIAHVAAANCGGNCSSAQKCCPGAVGCSPFCVRKGRRCCGCTSCRHTERCVASDTGTCK